MYKNYFKIAFRNLFKHKGFSFINITGLALGMASCLLILQYVRTERNYDNFQKDGDRIYRLKQNRYDQGKLTTEWAAGTAGIAQLVKKNCPEVEDVLKIAKSRAVTQYKDKVFREDQMYYVYDNFINFFSCKVIKGDPNTALKEPYCIVLTRSAAKRYFGEEDPMGKMIGLNNKATGLFKVTAIIEDAPVNTHFKYTVLLPYAKYLIDRGPGADKSFSWDGFYTYVRLKAGTKEKAFEDKMNQLAQKTFEEELKGGGMAGKIEFKLQPLKDIHLTSHYMMESEVNGDEKAVSFLNIIAFFIIVIAWINYVNLSTARSVDRAKEVGIRKVMGSYRSQLVAQFMFEAILINLMAVILSVVLIMVSLPLFNSLTGKEMGYDLFSQGKFWLTLTALFVTGTVFSGFYPAFALSSFMPIEVLKGKFAKSSRGSFLRQALVVVQFSASVILMVGTFAVYKQLNYMQDHDMGFNMEQILCLRGANAFDSAYAVKFTPFRRELEKLPGIKMVAASTAIPGKKVGWNAGGVTLVSDPTKQNQFRPIGIDLNYQTVYGLKLLHGRLFSYEFETDPDKSVLFNEEATKYFGFNKPEEALNKEIDFWGARYTIVGIVANHHQESLKEAYDGHIYRMMPDVVDFYSLKIEGKKSEYEKILSGVKDLWDRSFPENPFDYFFLDENFAKQYQADQNFGKTFALFAVLAIIIACLGLLGLASFVTTQRTKEIGIRKILGATLPNILYKLSSGFIKPVIVALLIAIPITYYLLNQWLQNFAFKISMNAWFFIVPSLIVVIVALVTITTQTMKAVSVNPVKNLRTE
jgi:putative ABC transport system permease protein